MKRDGHEDKKLGDAGIETKEVTITAENCPEKEFHKDRQGRKCEACGEAIPGHGMFTPAEFARYFDMHPYVEPPRGPNSYSDEEAAVMLEYERVRLAYVDTLFEIEDLQRGRAGARGKDANAAVGVRFDVDIANKKARAEKMYEGMGALLAEHNRLGAIRGARARRALWEDSYPPDAPPSSIGARIAAVIRGGSA